MKIHFRLDEGDSGSETMWAEETHPGHFRLENSPFFAFNVSYQDVVLAKPVGAELVFVETIRRSGHSTYRLIPVAERGAGFDAAWRPLQQLGCTFEEGPDGLLAVDVPPGADIFQAYSALEDGENQGVWTFEEGHCGHAVA